MRKKRRGPSDLQKLAEMSEFAMSTTIHDPSDDVGGATCRSGPEFKRPVSALGNIRPIATHARMAARTGNPRYKVSYRA